ncbi:glycosyltransferase [Eisenibacter elegans]|uniref:glycosyltransferase n=1 Tax=Eisenibacter elegans TaxID=997 RepID=UPI000408F431|nr:glycosyltransferase [Eisenibacter elegans]
MANLPSAGLAPIALFAYNRPQHLAQTLAALRQNPLAAQSQLYVFADGSRSLEDQASVAAVRQLVQNIEGFAAVELHLEAHNKGLAKSIIEGVRMVLAQHPSLIVLEDDLLTSTDFLGYMNEALKVYQLRPEVMSVAGYQPPFKIPQAYPHDVYLSLRPSSWGWATWRSAWELVDWEMTDFEQFIQDKDAQQRFAQGGADLLPMLVKQQRGLIHSWAIRWAYAHYQHRAYALYPRHSKVQNIGIDDSGQHMSRLVRHRYQTQLSNKSCAFPPDLTPDPAVLKAFERFYRPTWLRRQINHWRFST